MQTFIAESLYENGFQRRTFKCAEDEENEPIIKIFRSKLKLSETKTMNPDGLYNFFHKGMYGKSWNISSGEVLLSMQNTPPQIMPCHYFEAGHGNYFLLSINYNEYIRLYRTERKYRLYRLYRTERKYTPSQVMSDRYFKAWNIIWNLF